MLDNDFNISLGGQVDTDSVNLSIKNIENKIQPITLKVSLDVSNIQSQLQNIKLNLGTDLGSSSITKTKSKKEGASLSLSDIGVDESMLDKTRAKFNELNQEISETSTYIKDATTQVKVFGTVGADGAVKYKNYIQTTNTGLKEQQQLQKKNTQTIHDLEKAIQSYSNQGKLSTKETNKFQEQLGLIKSQTDEIKKSDALKELNTDIKAAANSTGLLGQSLSKAIIKYTTWLGIATIVAKISQAIKSMISEVVQLDEALTSLQMVTNYTNKEMQELKSTLVDMSKEMGVTVDALVSGADEWMRAGLSAADTMEALRASTVLATVANMDNATATEYLIAQMNAYSIAASDLISLVDKMSAVDIVAATSSQELGEALSVSAKSAQLAGIEYDKYLAMIATVSETTRQSASTIGNSFKTIFSRLQAVRIGSLVDEEGEDISDVDRLLKGYGINLMEVTNNLTDVGALLDLLGSKWDSYTTAQKSEIATTIAGTRQRERLLVLLDEYNRVLELEEVSLNSAGSAMGKYGIYQDSLEAKLNSLSASWTELADVTVNSDLIGWAIDAGKQILEFTTDIGGLANALMVLAGAFVFLKSVKVESIFGALGTAVGAITSVGFLIASVVSYINTSEQERLQRNIELAQSMVDSANEEKEAFSDLRDEYIQLAGQINRDEEQNNRLEEIKQDLINIYGEEANALDLVNGKYEDQIEIIDNLSKKTLADLERSYKQQYNAIMEKYASTTGSIGGSKWAKSVEAIASYGNELANQVLESVKGINEPVERLEILEQWYNKLADMELSGKNKDILNYIGEEIDELRPIVEELNGIQENLGNISLEGEYIGSPLHQLIVQYEKDLSSFSQLTAEEQTKYWKDLQSQIDAIKLDSAYDKFHVFFDSLIEEGQEYIDTLKQNDFLLTELDKKLSALQKQKELDEEELEIQEKLLKVEKAREELAKAKQQRIRVFRAGQGFVYEEDAEAIQEANESLQEALQDASQTDIDKAIATVEKLQEMYNQAQKDQAAAGKTDLREAFLDQDFLQKWLNWTVAEKMAYLDSFITTRDWNASLTPESILNWIPTNAGGDKNFRGGTTWVGEHGPELVNLPKGSEILSNQRSLRLSSILNNPSKYLGGSSGNTILQFNGALNFPNVRNESDANGFVKGLLQIGKNSIPNLT